MLSQFLLQISFMLLMHRLMSEVLHLFREREIVQSKATSGSRLKDIGNKSQINIRKRTKERAFKKKYSPLIKHYFIRHVPTNGSRFGRTVPCFVVGMPPRENLRDESDDSVLSERNEFNQELLSRILRIQQPTADGDQSFIQQSYVFRLGTFVDFPGEIFNTRLARNGWYSTGINDWTRCYFCQALHDGWRREDNPGMFHNHQCVMSPREQQIDNSQENQCSTNRPSSSMPTEDTRNMCQVARNTYHIPSLVKLNLQPRNQETISARTISNDAAVQEQTPQVENNSNATPVSIPLSEKEKTNQDENTTNRSNTNKSKSSTSSSSCNKTSVTVSSKEDTDNTDLSNYNNPDTDEKAQKTQECPPSSINHSQTNTSTPPEMHLEKEKTSFKEKKVDSPKYPKYNKMEVRLSSFTNWPKSITQSPCDVALAGFFYAGYGDCTRCFFCGGELCNWEAEDDPWVEHAYWFPKCRFVIRCRGQEFVDNIQRLYKEVEQTHQITFIQRKQHQDDKPSAESLLNAVLKLEKEPVVPENTRTTTRASTPSDTSHSSVNTEEQVSSTNSGSKGEAAQTLAKKEEIMKSAVVISIKDMEYSEEIIKTAITTIKSRLPRGKHKVSAQEILEVIFELADNQRASENSSSQSEPQRNVDQSESSSTPAVQSGATTENVTNNVSQSNSTTDKTDQSTSEETVATGTSNAELTSLRQENTSLKDQIMCRICMEKNVSIAFLPCCHLACCADCAPAMRKCPICRGFVKGTVKPFLS